MCHYLHCYYLGEGVFFFGKIIIYCVLYILDNDFRVSKTRLNNCHWILNFVEMGFSSLFNAIDSGRVNLFIYSRYGYSIKILGQYYNKKYDFNLSTFF